MELTYSCAECRAVGRQGNLESASEVVCSRCGAIRQLKRSAIESGGLCACAWCGTEDLYIQKDFPHGLGLAIVTVGFAVSTVFWAYYRPLSAFAVLLATAVLDGVLYHLVPDVTICYRCLCQYRGEGANPSGRFKPFDLGVGERYRQERLRVEELRERQEKPGRFPDAPPGGAGSV